MAGMDRWMDGWQGWIDGWMAGMHGEYVHVPVFLLNSYGAPMAQRAFYLVLHSSLFGPDDGVNYDNIVTNSTV